jgi:hypothetical protein
VTDPYTSEWRHMKLLKLGDKYINMDQVTDIAISDNHVEVFFIAPTHPPSGVYVSPGSTVGMRTLRFEGNDARFLQNWLDRNAEDLTK